VPARMFMTVLECMKCLYADMRVIFMHELDWCICISHP